MTAEPSGVLGRRGRCWPRSARRPEHVELLGPLVACTAFHPPGLIAKMAAATGRDQWRPLRARARRRLERGGVPCVRPPVRSPRCRASRSPSRLFAGCWPGQRVTVRGRYFEVDDAVLLPRPVAPLRLMIGSNGPRMLAAALPDVDAWNTWSEELWRLTDGFANLNERISGAARDKGVTQGTSSGAPASWSPWMARASDPPTRGRGR